MRLRAILLGLLLVGCSMSDQDLKGSEPSESAQSTAELLTQSVIATDTLTSSPVATRTPRPTRTPTIVPSITPTVDLPGLPAMRIGFIRSQDGGLFASAGGDIWVMNPDGSDQHQVGSYRPYPLGDFGVFSPDGCLFVASDAQQGVVFDLQTGGKVVIDQGDPGSPDAVTNFAWSPDSTMLTYYRGTSPDQPAAVRELRQVKQLANGSWSAPNVIKLDPSGETMLPMWALEDGRILTQRYGPGAGFYGVSYITDLTSGITRPLTFPNSDQLALISDATPDGHIVFSDPDLSDPNKYIGRITASGAITDVVTLAAAQETSVIWDGKFTPDQTGVLVTISVETDSHKFAKFEYGLFSLLDGGTTRYTTLLAPQPGIRGISSLGSQYAVVSIANDLNGNAPGEIWLVALDGSTAVPLTEGYLPVGLPICEK